MKATILTLLVLLANTILIQSFAQGSAEYDTTTTISNATAQAKKPYVILISVDGFRYDYAEKYHAKNLLALSAPGIRAQYMIPSYPSVTHPNHYAIVSGLYPGHSGIAGNSFYDAATLKKYKSGDGAWFGGEPIWVTAEKQQMLTANFQWVNGKAVIKSIISSYQYNGAKGKSVTTADRVNTIKHWLTLPEEKRPHLITMYFYDTDHAGHVFGPDAAETESAVKEIDEAVGKIAEAVAELHLPVNFVFVSDHGMVNIDKDHPLPVPSLIDTAKFVINNQNSLVNLYAKDTAAIEAIYNKLKAAEDSTYKVYRNANFPAKLHYGGKDDVYHRAGDIILVPVWPKTFNPKPGHGVHGFDPYTMKEMGAIFYAWGPAFKNDLHVKPFDNVEVYQVITSILGLQPAPNDGTGKLIPQILNHNQQRNKR